MKQKLTVALGQIDIVPGRPDLNAERVIKEIRAAARRGVHIIVFPELAVPGYLIGDMPEDDAFVRDVFAWTDRIVAATGGLDIVVIFGTYVGEDGTVGSDGRIRKYNAGIVAQHGRVVESTSGQRFFAKTLMPTYRMFDDERHYMSQMKRTFENGATLQDLLAPFEVTIQGKRVRIGAMVCEDMWDQDYTLKPGRIIAEAGIDLMVNISCSPWGWQKNRKRHQVVRDLVQDIKVPFVYVNNVGCQNNGKNLIVFDGSSTVYTDSGDVAFVAEPYEDKVADVRVAYDLVPIQVPGRDDVSELFAGIIAGIRGYFRTLPPSMQTVVVGISGGIDSAVVAALMVHILGRERVMGVNMPYEGFSSKETRTIASSIADALGIRYREMPITDIVRTTAGVLGIGEGTAEHKSIQARARMEVLAALAHRMNGIFTSNANKVEFAFGYGTLTADLRGMLAPLGDCVKGEVYQLAYHLNTKVFDREVIPRACFDIAPMDELSTTNRGDPFDYGKVTEDGTWVRGYHDEVVRALVEFRRNPEWFLLEYQNGTLEATLKLPEGRLKALFPDTGAFVADLERHWSLFFGNVFKRVQSVPAPLISKRAFGYDYREAMVSPHYTLAYQKLKEELLG